MRLAAAQAVRAFPRESCKRNFPGVRVRVRRLSLGDTRALPADELKAMLDEMRMGAGRLARPGATVGADSDEVAWCPSEFYRYTMPASAMAPR
jgi:hypothetical protein